MNEGKPYLEFHIAELADIMGLSKASELESYLADTNEPTFDFVERFSSCFGGNSSWLKFGIGQPYKSTEPFRYHYPRDYYHRIQELNPQYIFFVRSKDSLGKSTIALQMTEWRWVTLPDYWHISSQVGGTGKHLLYEFYRLSRKLQETEWKWKCFGRMVDRRTFEKLLSGELFPGSVLSLLLPLANNHGWDDFVDVHHTYAVAKNYHSMYGYEFVKAQMIELVGAYVSNLSTQLVTVML
jgi:hypothetical protein